MPALKKMQVTVTGNANLNGTYYFMSNPALYAGIAAQTGITPAVEPSKVIHRVEDLLLYNVLESIAVTVGTTAASRKTIKVLCAPQLAQAAEDALMDKVIPQGTISGVSADLKAQEYLS